MEKYIYLIAGVSVGAVIIYLWLKQQYATKTARLQANLDYARDNNALDNLQEKYNKLEEKLNTKSEDCTDLIQKLATANANNKALEEKLKTQKKEIEGMGEKFNTEFENIAGKILKANTKSFSEVNESKIKELLNPLGKNIKEFKDKVEQVYDKEAKERFSLGQKVT